jgi:ribonuclease HI
MSAGRKFYAVVKGVQPGLYGTWAEAEPHVKGFAGALYKGFAQLSEAIAWFEEKAGRAPDLLGTLASTSITHQQGARNAAREHDWQAQLNEGKAIIFTDGGADPNPGPGGYGVVMLYGGPPGRPHRKELNGGFRRTTNNRMEIMACIAALSALKRHSEVVVYTDSRYLADAIGKGWAQRWRANGWRRNDGQPAINADLWARLLDLLDQHTVSFVWLKGHAGSRENERCDQLATQAAHQPNLPVDEGFEAQGDN